MAEAHTKTELRAMKKADLIAALLDVERKYAACEREVWGLRYLHDFPAIPQAHSDPRRRAERFMLATARGLVFAYRGVDTTIPAVSRAVVNHLRETVRQYDEAIAECDAAQPPSRGDGSARARGGA